jgi:2-polyprenyl-6-methoxyphenol hydroxylase-like FAD-dependent oxidoreductase
MGTANVDSPASHVDGGKMMQVTVGHGSRSRGHAVVVGGSMAGLLAARVLSEFFERVTIIERDGKPPAAATRKGVPQARHVHVLLRRGSDILEELFPGFIRGVLDHGAVLVDMLNRLPFFLGGWHAGCPKRTLEGLFASRALLEWQVDERVRRIPGVELRDGTEVITLLPTRNGRGVRAVLVRDMATRSERELPADLVVDASGRGSRLPRWLVQLGYPAPHVSEVSLPVDYATQIFRRDAGRRRVDGLIISSKPPGGRGGALFPIENGQWMATLTGLADDPPPSSSTADFLAFAQSLPSRELFDMLVNAEPLSPIHVHHFRSNLRRHYERCHRFPAGLAVLGDAVSSLNPRFSQGMTIAAMEALELRRTLAGLRGSDLRGIGLELARRVSRVVDLAWPGVVAADLSWPGAIGESSTQLRFLQWYRAKIFQRTIKDGEARETFVRVTNFLDPPRRLYSPSFVACVLLADRRSYKRLSSGVQSLMPMLRFLRRTEVP